MLQSLLAARGHVGDASKFEFCCSVLQYVAVPSPVARVHVGNAGKFKFYYSVLQRVVVCCSVV